MHHVLATLIAGMIEVCFSGLLTVRGKSSAFGFGEWVRFITAVKMQAAIKRTFKSLDRHIFIAICFSMLSFQNLCVTDLVYSEKEYFKIHKLMIFRNELFPNAKRDFQCLHTGLVKNW